MSVKRNDLFDGHDNLRVIALQAHQISGTMDPRLPIRALLAPEPPRRAAVRRLTDPQVGRLINERLAPAG